MRERKSAADERRLLEERLRIAIEQHLPGSRNREEGQSRSRSHLYALRLSFAVRSPTEHFGRSSSSSSFTDLKDALRDAQRVLSGLSHEDRLLLSWSCPDHEGQKDADIYEAQFQPNENHVDNLEQSIDTVLSGIRQRLKSPERAKASKKRSWRAASVASVCRTVWALEHIALEKEEWLEFCEQNGSKGSCKALFVEQFAPKAQAHEAPGPFGKFVEAVFAAAGMNEQEGDKKLSAASALNSLRSLGR